MVTRAKAEICMTKCNFKSTSVIKSTDVSSSTFARLFIWEFFVVGKHNGPEGVLYTPGEQNVWNHRSGESCCKESLQASLHKICTQAFLVASVACSRTSLERLVDVNRISNGQMFWRGVVQGVSMILEMQDLKALIVYLVKQKERRLLTVDMLRTNIKCGTFYTHICLVQSILHQ